LIDLLIDAVRLHVVLIYNLQASYNYCKAWAQNYRH